MLLNDLPRRAFPAPSPPRLDRPRWPGVVLRALALLLLLVPSAALAASPAAEASGLEKQIAQEQARAKARRDSLSRMTAEERGIDKDLAGAEAAILRLENSLAREERTLENLAASDLDLLAKGKTVRTELAKTEHAMTEVLHVLWELHARRLGVGGRDLPDWHMTDREHAWSAELFTALDAHRKTLAEQEKELAVIGARRDALQREANARILALNAEKEELLAARVRYGKRLAELRKSKQDVEEELKSVLALVRNLNLRLLAAEEQGDIAKAQGKLPWPVSGKVRKRFDPSARPPVRGVTLGLPGDTEVRAVHWGKVVHNDVLRGIGRVVILMHGEEYYSLYAFLSDSPMRVGQEVAKGEVLGTSGFVTTIDGPGLYFELRHHQKAVNPEQWLHKL